MRKIVNPFAGLEKHENELKRHALYGEIKQLLIHAEAYDDSGIGHEFVTHFERELPGIITAHTQDHSFINGTPEENRRIIMEAVDSGMALKTGIVAAILLLVYKIIRVVINNKEFGKDGGGRGSAAYTTQQFSDLKTQVDRFNENKKELKVVIPSAANNPLHTEEDSKVYKSADKAIQVFQIDDNGNANPVKMVEKIEFVATPGNLAAFFAFKDTKKSAEVLGKVDKVYKAMSRFNISKFINLMMTVASAASTTNLAHTTKAFNDEQSAKTLLSQINEIARAFDISAEVRSVEDLKTALTPYLDVDAVMNRSYKRVLEENAGEVLSIAELSKSVMDIADGRSALKAIFDQTVVFNEEFTKITDNESDLEDSKFYQSLNMFVTALTGAKEALQSEKPEGYDSAAQRITQYIQLHELFTRGLLKIFATFRKQSDTGNEFLKVNIAKLEEVNKALETVITEVKTDEGA